MKLWIPGAYSYSIKSKTSSSENYATTVTRGTGHHLAMIDKIPTQTSDPTFESNLQSRNISSEIPRDAQQCSALMLHLFLVSLDFT